MAAAPLVLLDLDGTLTDSGPGIFACAADAFRTLGLPVPTAAELRTFVGPPIADSFRAHGVPADRVRDAVTAYRAAFVAGGMYDNAVFDGIPEALRRLRADGCRLVVATSKPQVYAEPICARFGLDVLVDGVFGAPPDDVPSTKADVIAAALAAIGDWSRGTTVMVGDREHDAAGAAAHGLRCVGVSWGYAGHGELERAGAVEVVDSPSALVATVRRLVGLTD
ncbi:HAD hydrolase-like protein [Cellulomonas alba]|uniref:HAD hydrolase-like protein n=1 Tax=Cellulomonas alba TaxID=3053467 RepID=A0ABT7SIS3_9CELL|nr:HAD hydrolase-like protein [Cellulomonas alba]MDM7856051.1 HAD hydrolase-like protein [Cellulomonas alba]